MIGKSDNVGYSAAVLPLGAAVDSRRTTSGVMLTEHSGFSPPGERTIWPPSNFVPALTSRFTNESSSDNGDVNIRPPTSARLARFTTLTKATVVAAPRSRRADCLGA